ncbi:MAG: hypothetical protein Q8P58_00190 [Candidatus Adlerbacteria bacterium]|nr:hypothetical protein [Candidatus Adlerbacteria bacterium]
MNDVLLTKIIFTITAVAVSAITLGILAVLWFIIPMVRDLREMVGKIRKAGEHVEKDFEALRANLHEEGHKAKTIVDLALNFVGQKLKPKATRRPKKPSSSESQPH